MAAGMAGLRHLPTLVEEAGASLRGLKAMKESGQYSPEELKSARNLLLHAGGTYLGGALGEAAGAAGAAKLWPALRKARLDPQGSGAISAALPLAGLSLGSGLPHIGLKKHMRGGSLISPEQAEEMRTAMGAKAGLHRLGPVGSKAIGSAYARFDPESLHTPSDKEIAELGKIVHKGTPEVGQDIVNRGGVLLEPLKPLKKAAEAKKEPERKPFSHRLVKKLGLGALSLGVAAPIIYASLPPTAKQKVRERLGGAFSKVTGKIAIKHVPAEKFRAAGLHPGSTDYKRVIEIAKNAGVLDLRHEKLASDQHWSAVAAALVA